MTAALSALAFLKGHWRLLGVGVLLVVIGFLWLRLEAVGAELHAEQAAHRATIASYRQKVAEAKAADIAHARAVEAEQARITERAEDDYKSRIAAVRARYDRLLAKTRADSGRGGTENMPGVSNTPGGIDEAACKDRLPAADALIATEQAIQLEALQRWVRGQAEAR